MSDKNKAEVKIRGRFYTITANEPEEYIYKICSYVDKKMNEITKMNSRLNTDMAAVLTAINITDELYKAKSSEETFKQQTLNYDEENDKNEEQIKQLKEEIAVLKEELKQKDEELTQFLEQF